MFVVCMLLKDEAETIRQTLDSVVATLGAELRTIVIHDTGSTDGTPSAAQDGPHAFFVRLWSAAWRDFSTNRNDLLAEAEAQCKLGDVILMLDAGTILRGDPVYGPARANAWTVGVRLGNLEYKRPQLFAPGCGWRYAGKVHEAASGPGEPGTCDLVVDYCLRDAARPARWKRDLSLLEDDYSPRGRFYYAQTLQLTGAPALAYFWYLHRGGRSDGWHEERAMAYIRAIPLAPSLVAAEWCAVQALSVDPTRGEAWQQLAMYSASVATTPAEWRNVRTQAENALEAVPGPGALFVDTAREYHARELIARATFWSGDQPRAWELWMALLPTAPEWARTQLIENLKFCEGE